MSDTLSHTLPHTHTHTHNDTTVKALLIPSERRDGGFGCQAVGSYIRVTGQLSHKKDNVSEQVYHLSALRAHWLKGAGWTPCSRLDRAATPGSTAARLKCHSTTAWKQHTLQILTWLTYLLYILYLNLKDVRSQRQLDEITPRVSLTDDCDLLLLLVGRGQNRIQPVQLVLAEPAVEHGEPAKHAHCVWNAQHENPLLITLGSVKWHKRNKKWIQINLLNDRN